MKRMVLLLLVVALWATSETSVEAQIGYVTYYQPATVYPQPVTVYRPAPVVYSSYYAPAPTVVGAPVGVYQPVTRVRTRYRPILGGTVTRVRHGYVYHPAPIVYAY